MKAYFPKRKPTNMHEELWAGVELKARHAAFFLDQMGKALLPPERTQHNVAIESSGAIVDTRWQTSFYAYLDAFLAMARSAPEIVSSCFGADADRGPKDMKTWFASLAPAEQTRRRSFSVKFEPGHKIFRKLALSSARNISLHRRGVPPVRIKMKGRFGIWYTGDPTRPIPSSETRNLNDPDLQWLSRPVRLDPRWQDFTIKRKPLFDACKAYLSKVEKLVQRAKKICVQVHGHHSLTLPPS